MEIPAPRTWVDGEIVTPQDLNEQIRDAQEFLLAKPQVSLVQEVQEAVASPGYFPMSFQGVEIDTDGMFDPLAPTDITIQTAGVYLVIGQGSFEPNTTGYRTVRLTLPDSATNIAMTRVSTTAPSGETSVNVSAITALSVGDRIQLQLNQNSGSTLNTDHGQDAVRPRLSALWVANLA